MEESDSGGEYEDFFEEEDFSAEPCRLKTIEIIRNDMFEILSILPDVAEWSVLSYGNLDIADFSNSVMLSFRLGKHERPKMLPSIEIYKPDSQEHTEGGHLGDIIFFIYNDPGRHVVFEVFSFGIRKRHRIIPALEADKDGDDNKAVLRMLRELAEILKREQETEKLFDVTGVGFVSENSAKHLKFVTENFKDYVLSYFEK